MDFKQRYSIQAIRGKYQLIDNTTSKITQISKKEAQILTAILKNSNQIKTLGFLKKKYPRTHWKLVDITLVENAFKKLTYKNKKQKDITTYIYFKVYMIVLSVILVLMAGAYISNYQIFIDINRFFWNDSIVIIMITALISYCVLSLIHELFQYFICRLTGLPAHLRSSFNFSIFEVYIEEDDLFSLKRNNRLIFFLSGISIEFLVFSLLSLIVLYQPHSSILNEILIIAFIRISFQFFILYKSDVYFFIQHLLNIKDLNKKSFTLKKIPEQNTSKITSIRLYRIVYLCSILLLMFLMTLIIPIKLQIYIRSFNQSFYAFFGLDILKFILGIATILVEIFIDLISIKLLFNIFSKDLI